MIKHSNKYNQIHTDRHQSHRHTHTHAHTHTLHAIYTNRQLHYTYTYTILYYTLHAIHYTYTLHTAARVGASSPGNSFLDNIQNTPLKLKYNMGIVNNNVINAFPPTPIPIVVVLK